MLKPIPEDLFRILFLDIETVSQKERYEDLSSRMQHLWDVKCNYWRKHASNPRTHSELYQDKAAIFAEFGKVVCISAGYLCSEEGGTQFKMKSWYGENEYQLLEAFADLISTRFSTPMQQRFCGHNIKEFDIPYLCRRMLVHQIEIPNTLNIQGKKPWEVNHLHDTLEMWKFGDFKHFISLDLLAAIFDISSPKESMDGSKVGTYYYRGQLEGIVTYCERDVLTVLKIYLRLLNLSSEFEVIDVENERYD